MRTHNRAEKNDDDEAIGGDFFGPCETVVQHVTGEELQEDAKTHAPEHGKGYPVFHRIG
jgi:hypothetical protein